MQTFRPFDFGSAKRNTFECAVYPICSTLIGVTLNFKNATRKHTTVDIEVMYKLDARSTPMDFFAGAEISNLHTYKLSHRP